MNGTGKKRTDLKSKKFSPIDVVIAVIFLVALFSMAYLIITLVTDDGSAAKTEGVAADCQLVIENVDTERFGITINEVTGAVECEFLQVDDQVYDPQSGEAIGKITAIAYEKAAATSGEVDEEGNLIYVEYPGHVDLILTLRTELSSAQNYSVGSLQLRIGQNIHLRTASYEATAWVEDVETGGN